jgi:DNA-binding response OmpR family regulator
MFICGWLTPVSEWRPATANGSSRDLPEATIRRGPKATVDLTAREFLLAEVFCRHPDQVLSREQLLSQVWGFDFDPGSNVVDVYIRYLRKKLGPDRIQTIRGMGYRLRTS